MSICVSVRMQNGKKTGVERERWRQSKQEKELDRRQKAVIRPISSAPACGLYEEQMFTT